MHDTSFPTYIVTQEVGMAPRKKGPFYALKMVEEFLREAYKLDPKITCIVIDGPLDETWYPEHGYAWLDIHGDRRRRHPRKDRPTAGPPPAAAQKDLVRMLATYEEILRVVCHHLELPQSESGPADDLTLYDRALAAADEYTCKADADLALNKEKRFAAEARAYRFQKALEKVAAYPDHQAGSCPEIARAALSDDGSRNEGAER